MNDLIKTRTSKKTVSFDKHGNIIDQNFDYDGNVEDSYKKKITSEDRLANYPYDIKRAIEGISETIYEEIDARIDRIELHVSDYMSLMTNGKLLTYWIGEAEKHDVELNPKFQEKLLSIANIMKNTQIILSNVAKRIGV